MKETVSQYEQYEIWDTACEYQHWKRDTILSDNSMKETYLW